MSKEYHIITRKIEIRVNETDSIIKNEEYKKLRKYETFCRRASNIISTTQYTLENLPELFFLTDDIKYLLNKKKDDEDKESLLNTSRQNTTYQLISKLADEYDVPSIIKASLNDEIFKVLKKDLKDIKYGNKSLRTYKKNLPIPFMKSGITDFNYEPSIENFTFKIFKTRFATILGKDKSNNKSIVNNLLNDVYGLCNSSIQFKDKKLFLNLVVKIPKEEIKLDKDKIIGVDLGINTPAYCALSTNLKIRKAVGSREEFYNKKLGFDKKRKILSRNLKYNIKSGHGKKSKVGALHRIRQVESNWRNLMNHKYAKEIIMFAIKNGSGMIHMEDLSNIKDVLNSKLLGDWTYYDLQKKIEEKANKYNIEVKYINPRNTSKTCSTCGHLDDNNRPKKNGSEEFKCVLCGYEENADFNAAINIANSKNYSDKKNKITERVVS